MQDDTRGPGPRFLIGAHLLLSVIAGLFFSSLSNAIFPETTVFWYALVGFSLYLGGCIPSFVYMKMTSDSKKKIVARIAMFAIVTGSVFIVFSITDRSPIIDYSFAICLVIYGFFMVKKGLRSSTATVD